MPDVFISYASRDASVAREVASALANAGVTAFVAESDILPGQSWTEAILRAITSSQVFVLILTKSANESRQVIREVELAENNGLTICPYLIGQVHPVGALEYLVGSRQWIDGNDEGSVHVLVTAVQSALTAQPTAALSPAESLRPRSTATLSPVRSLPPRCGVGSGTSSPEDSQTTRPHRFHQGRRLRRRARSG